MTPEELFETDKRVIDIVLRNHFWSATGEWKSELLAEGRVYLWKAAISYDPEKGDFFNYAYAQVWGGMMCLRTNHKAMKRTPPGRKVSLDYIFENDGVFGDIYGSSRSAEDEVQWREYVREGLKHPLLSLRLKGYGRREVAEMSGMGLWACDYATRRAMNRLMEGLPAD